MTDIDKMSKDDLAEYAKSTFNVDLDMRKSLSSLHDEVAKMAERPETPTEEQPEIPTYTHIKNIKTGLVFQWTQPLQDYLGNDGKLCNEAGA